MILSAQDFTAEPLARAHLPVRVPLGLHGSWVPTQE
ncbi:carotenoid oxygenase family protein [Actinacidiphila rubida]|uniref:Dioxygenase n=1 Tax=Actinacidiphila rubida TaxID=310780 RepID=A0A1H8LHB2_9ACTN|nr:carotenoid oxygenase family protein [Actinacidiphila rubida]SEO04497.1 carotenoid cleavage dioxygenase [Actinacidiphila rubida]